MLRRIGNWLNDRFGLHEVREHFLWRRVPKDPWYTGDGMAMVLLFVIQVITGIVLALSYSPSVTGAYDSVEYITRHQILGWFVRGLHYWSGGMWVVLLVYHILRQILVGGYKSPREGTWLLGVVLFFLVISMSLLGYALRWDERGLYALRVATSIFYQVPLIGERLVLLVQGGYHLSDLTLTRLYAAHVVFGPVLLGVLIAYHLYLVVVRGTTTEREKEVPIHSAEQQKRIYEQEAHAPGEGEHFFPETPARLSPIPLAVFAAVVGLTVAYGPRNLMPEASLTSAPRPAEEWWFAWYSALTAKLPGSIAPTFHWVFPLALFAVLVALPFVDRWKENRGARDRPIAVVVVCLVAIGILYLSALRYRSPWTAWPQDKPPTVPATMVLTERADRGRVLFKEYGCYNCHAVAGEGPEVGPDIARLRRRYSLDGIRRYVLAPPPGVAMPAYGGRMPPEDLELVVEFCHVAQMFPHGR